MESSISPEKVERYLAITREALEKIKITAASPSFGGDIARNFMEMATSYHSDAGHFFEKGDLVNAFACVNYAHGWLDAGVRLGVFDAGGDDRLFTLLR